MDEINKNQQESVWAVIQMLLIGGSEEEGRGDEGRGKEGIRMKGACIIPSVGLFKHAMNRSFVVVDLS